MRNQQAEVGGFLLLSSFQEKHNLELKFENARSLLESEVRARERAEAERDKLRGQLTLLKELILNDQECYSKACSS